MKVIPRIIGGLGNQLFSYCAARRLALANGAELVLDNVSGFRYDHEYQQKYQLDHFHIQARIATAAERLEPFSRVRRYIKRRVNRKRSFEMRKYIQQERNDFDPRLLQVKLLDTVYLEGYWQSEGYFKDIEPIIRSDLKIISPTDSVNLQLAARIQNCTAVAVHVRFFDAPATLGGNNAPSEYYNKAITMLEELAPNAHYFLFSDNPTAARALASLPNTKITLVSHNRGDSNAYADLWLMSLCKHFIIANSTFSWWGAWLADHEDKIVLAPGFQIREGKTAWGFDGLLPQSWIRI